MDLSNIKYIEESHFQSEPLFSYYQVEVIEPKDFFPPALYPNYRPMKQTYFLATKDMILRATSDFSPYPGVGGKMIREGTKFKCLSSNPQIGEVATWIILGLSKQEERGVKTPLVKEVETPPERGIERIRSNYKETLERKYVEKALLIPSIVEKIIKMAERSANYGSDRTSVTTNIYSDKDIESIRALEDEDIKNEIVRRLEEEGFKVHFKYTPNWVYPFDFMVSGWAE